MKLICQNETNKIYKTASGIRHYFKTGADDWSYTEQRNAELLEFLQNNDCLADGPLHGKYRRSSNTFQLISIEAETVTGKIYGIYTAGSAIERPFSHADATRALMEKTTPR